MSICDCSAIPSVVNCSPKMSLPSPGWDAWHWLSNFPARRQILRLLPAPPDRFPPGDNPAGGEPAPVLALAGRLPRDRRKIPGPRQPWPPTGQCNFRLSGRPSNRTGPETLTGRQSHPSCRAAGRTRRDTGQPPDLKTDPGLRGDKEPAPPPTPSPGKTRAHAQGGMLIQIGGSQHRWLGDEHPQLSLHLAVDDATGKVLAACFRPDQDACGYFELLGDLIGSHGARFIA